VADGRFNADDPSQSPITPFKSDQGMGAIRSRAGIVTVVTSASPAAPQIGSLANRAILNIYNGSSHLRTEVITTPLPSTTQANNAENLEVFSSRTPVFERVLPNSESSMYLSLQPFVDC